MSKQDRQGVRRASDLEQKYSFGRVFSNQSKLNEEQEQQLDTQRLTLSQFVSYASTAIKSLQNDLAAANNRISSFDKSLQSLSDKDSQIEKQITDYWQTIYPIGHIYVSLDETSPETLFGGKWERIKDGFLLSANETYEAGSTGGEAAHTLSVSEMPSHNHTQSVVGARSGTGSTYVSWNASNVTGSTASSYNTTFSTGGGGAHNNMPPYLAVYMWKRTA